MSTPARAGPCQGPRVAIRGAEPGHLLTRLKVENGDVIFARHPGQLAARTSWRREAVSFGAITLNPAGINVCTLLPA